MPSPVSRVLSSLAAAVLLLAACDRAPSWQEIKAPDGGFRIEMRGDARIEKQDVETPIGKITGNWYSTEPKNAVFGVGYSDFPPEVARNMPPRRLFTIVRESWLKRIQGKLQGDGADIRLDGYPGMEFVAWGKFKEKDAYLRGRLYLVDTRLYQVVVFGDKETVPLSDVNHFMNSFKLIKVAPVNPMDIDMGGRNMPPIQSPPAK